MKERKGVSAHPLAWPLGWERTKVPSHSRFGGSAYKQSKHPLTVYSGVQMVRAELDRIVGISDVVISTNLDVRNDGIPYSGQKEPADSGVAVYFRMHGDERVLACDRWRTVAENLRAIAKHIEAMRGQDRWGVGSLEQAFRGFVGIPETAGRERTWREVFEIPDGVAVSRDFIQLAYKTLARKRHPDHGGSNEEMAELSRARDAALEEIG